MFETKELSFKKSQLNLKDIMLLLGRYDENKPLNQQCFDMLSYLKDFIRHKNVNEIVVEEGVEVTRKNKDKLVLKTSSKYIDKNNIFMPDDFKFPQKPVSVHIYKIDPLPNSDKAIIHEIGTGSPSEHIDFNDSIKVRQEINYSNLYVDKDNGFGFMRWATNKAIPIIVDGVCVTSKDFQPPVRMHETIKKQNALIWILFNMLACSHEYFRFKNSSNLNKASIIKLIDKYIKEEKENNNILNSDGLLKSSLYEILQCAENDFKESELNEENMIKYFQHALKKN